MSTGTRSLISVDVGLVSTATASNSITSDGANSSSVKISGFNGYIGLLVDLNSFTALSIDTVCKNVQ